MSDDVCLIPMKHYVATMLSWRAVYDLLINLAAN